MEYKTALDPDEWYSWKRTHPEQYKIIKQYILSKFPFVTVEYKGTIHTNLLIPRLYFTFGEMLGFLSKHHHLKTYVHIHYNERKHYKGGTYTRIAIDHDAVPITLMCDYMWHEVRSLLAQHKNLLS